MTKQALLAQVHETAYCEHMDDQPALRDFLDNWRLARRWSLQRLADEVGVHQSLVSKWLHPNPRRRVTPSPVRLKRIAEVTGVPYAKLRDLAEIGEDDPQPATEAVEQSELEARLARLGVTLSRYPRAFWLAVVESSERMAEVGEVLSEHPVTAPGQHGVSGKGRRVTRAKHAADGGLPNWYPHAALAVAGTR